MSPRSVREVLLQRTMRRLSLSLFPLLFSPAVVICETPPAVTIRVVDLAEIGPEPLVVSLDVTQALFDAVGVAVSWRHCRDGIDDCSDPLLPHEVWLRVAPGNAEHGGWAAEWISTQALGFSNVTPSPHTSVMSTVFMSQVDRLADAAGIGASDLLGRVAAHEVAHLLLGTAGHTATGLMGARWSVRTSPDQLRFSSGTGSQLRVAAAQRSQSRPEAEPESAASETRGRPIPQ